PATADSTIPGSISEAEVRKASHEEIAQAPVDTAKPDTRKPDAKPEGADPSQTKLPAALVIPRDLLPPGVEATKLPERMPPLPDKMTPEEKARRKRLLRPYL